MATWTFEHTPAADSVKGFRCIALLSLPVSVAGAVLVCSPPRSGSVNDQWLRRQSPHAHTRSWALIVPNIPALNAHQRSYALVGVVTMVVTMKYGYASCSTKYDKLCRKIGLVCRDVPSILGENPFTEELLESFRSQ